MNEDTKTKLEEKKDSVASDEELDQIAGGTIEENMDLLNAMVKLDPNGVKAVFDNAAQVSETTGSNYYQLSIAIGTQNLIKKHFGKNFDISAYDNNWDTNDYSPNGKSISHAQMLGMINDRIKDREKFANGLGFEVVDY